MVNLAMGAHLEYFSSKYVTDVVILGLTQVQTPNMFFQLPLQTDYSKGQITHHLNLHVDYKSLYTFQSVHLNKVAS